MKNRTNTGHRFLVALELTDGDVMNIGIAGIKFAEFRLMGMMNRIDHRNADEPGKG